MKKSVGRVLLVSVGLLAVVGVLAAIKGGQISSMIDAGKSFRPPPEPVTTAKVEADEWEGTLAAVGTVVPVRSVVVASEVPGKILELGFESGAVVQKGQVLVRLDSSIEQAQLIGSQADAELARVNVERSRTLAEAKAVPPQELDAAEARSKLTQSQVLGLEAVVAKKTIRAPFAGRLGIREVELGQILGSGAPIATLTALDQVYVDFYLPQQALQKLQVDQVIRLSTDAYPGEAWNGKLVLINSDIESSTRNVHLRSRFDNADGRLRPGMFASATVVLPETGKVLIIPATAVIYAPYGDSIFLVDEKDGGLVARQQFVRLGEKRGDFVAVTSGVEAGQTVVTTGAFKLRNGVAVKIDNTLAPAVSTAPKPSDS